MKKKDSNWVVKVEKAIAEKYGDIAIQNPRSFWNEEKEASYLEQIKQRYKKDNKQRESSEKINKDGFFLSKKLHSIDATTKGCVPSAINVLSRRKVIMLSLL